MLDIIGREAEEETFNSIYHSGVPEFIALFGRRRVGKTYLVRNYFAKKKNIVFFYATGMKEGNTAQQIANFTEQIGPAFYYPGAQLERQKTWRDTFRILTDNINVTQKDRKIILFFDEFPWMATPRSGLLQTLEYYWNQHWSNDARIKLIICGSSAGWILKNIIHNKGGLYNRVTRSIQLEPFDLRKTKEYLQHKNIKLNYEQLVDLYMVLGGIPHYLSKIERGLSARQIIEKLAFRKNSFLLREFNDLYATLFSDANTYIDLVRIIANHPYGIGQEEIAHQIKNSSSGGTIVLRLENLEQAGFIIRFKPFNHEKRGVYYKVIDEYTLFYFSWVEEIKNSLLARGMRKGYWESKQNSASWHSWAGYAFESICFKHIAQISAALNLNPTAVPYTWRYVPTKGENEQGAQIDLLFDRDDGFITLCEIKYTDQPFLIDKQYAEKLKRKWMFF